MTRQPTAAERRVLSVMASSHVLIHFDDVEPAYVLWVGARRTTVKLGVVEALVAAQWIEPWRQQSWRITAAGRAALTRRARGKDDPDAAP